MRAFYFLAGLVMLGLGIAGAMLPLLPATPFLLAAAWLLSRSSPRLERWLLNHPIFGATLRNWRRDGAIAPRTKLLAVACMAASYALTWAMISPGPWLATGLAAILLCCASFVVTRPSPRAEATSEQ